MWYSRWRFNERRSREMANEIASEWTDAFIPQGDPDLCQTLRDAVDKLPPKRREAIKLVYFAHVKPAEAAAQLGCDEKTFRNRLDDARRHLRQILAVDSGTNAPRNHLDHHDL